MNPQAFVMTPEQYPRTLDVLGVQITVLAPKTATQAYEITLQRGDEGGGPPPHSHPWDESFFVTAGTVDFDCAGSTQQVGAGTLVHVPAGTVHAFRFGRGGGAMIEFTGAGTGASTMFTDMAQRVPPGPPDVPALIALLKGHRVSVAL